MNNSLRLSCLLSVAFFLITLSSCDNSYSPKPMGYFRIDCPKKEYKVLDSIYPYSFSYPSYASLVPKTDSMSEPYWIDLRFPQFKGTVYISYKAIDHNLPAYLEDARKMVMKHIPKANSIDEQLFSDPAHQVYGTFYDIRGNNAASPFQFYLTDSTRHFLRGALYFYTTPNNDSLQPVIDFLKEDLLYLAKTLRWKDKPVQKPR
jgi:gliding motility-associated lipoprotein GldD